MGFKLVVHDALNVDLVSNVGITSRFKSARFRVCAALTDGCGNPLSDKGRVGLLASGSFLGSVSSKTWECTSEAKAVAVPGDCARGKCSWNEMIDLGETYGPISPDSIVELALRRDFGTAYPSREIGRTRVAARELAEMDELEDMKGVGGGMGAIELMLFDLGRFDCDGNVVSAGSDVLPTILRVSVARSSLPLSLMGSSMSSTTNATLTTPEMTSGRSVFAKRLMIVTRGTRGDVQPFVALARGLAEMENWEVIFVTELSYKAQLKSQTNVKKGRIRFRPSGGDTMKTVDSRISQKAINLKINARQTNMMQRIFLARSEIEFFPSEPAVFHWAQKMKPDLLIFGFTMASVTLIASEALGIPVIGFVLQPTSIPSSKYPPVLPLQEEAFNMLTAESMDKKHDSFKMLKYAMENLGGKANSSSLASLRTRRGLEMYTSYKRNTWQELKDKNFPLIVPINETLFGGKPDDWSENSVFTDCIFLRGDSVPPIADDARAFINKCKLVGGKIVVLAFSSMPVSKSAIVLIALKIIQECESKACVFALVGGQMNLPLENNVEVKANEAICGGRLFLASGAPFGRLFPLVDAVVLHGGLGTTSEVIQAQIPAIVTGVLLLDQRFWGSRCSQLNVGPFGTHIDDFPDKCVEFVDKALADESVWLENAKKIGLEMANQAGDDPSGVRRNVECVVRMSGIAKPYYYHQADDENLSSCSDQGIGALQESLVQSKLSVEDSFGFDEIYVQAA